MNVLVLNCGSSSLNYKVFQGSGGDLPEKLAWGKAHRVGVTGREDSFLEHHGVLEKHIVCDLSDHNVAVEQILSFLQEVEIKIDAVGHRFVHGGDRFTESVLIDENVLALLQSCLPLAPIHNPNSMGVIQVCLQSLPDLPQYVTFDTAFHATLLPEAYTYALPQELTREYHLRKYGFHGLSYQYVCETLGRHIQTPLTELRIIACHLGTGGSSCTAIAGGKSIETSMGFSPLQGLVMSTRCGDIDPQIILMLLEQGACSVEELNMILNKQSGLLGVSGASSDIRDLLKMALKEPEGQAALAISLYIHRLKEYIGAYAAVLGGLDMLVFTDDVGAGVWQVRERVCRGLEWMGIELDSGVNAMAKPDQIYDVASEKSAVRIISMPTDEELVIAREGLRLLQK